MSKSEEADPTWKVRGDCADEVTFELKRNGSGKQCVPQPMCEELKESQDAWNPVRESESKHQKVDGVAKAKPA